MATHEVEFGVAARWFASCPEKFQLLEVSVQRGRVEDEEAGGLGAGVAKGVCVARGYQHEGSDRSMKHFLADTKFHLPVQDEIGLVVVDVAVSRGHPSRGRQGSLHQRKACVGVDGRGLEPHLAAPRLATESYAASKSDHDAPPMSLLDAGLDNGRHDGTRV